MTTNIAFDLFGTSTPQPDIQHSIKFLGSIHNDPEGKNSKNRLCGNKVIKFHESIRRTHRYQYLKVKRQEHNKVFLGQQLLKKLKKYSSSENSQQISKLSELLEQLNKKAENHSFNQYMNADDEVKNFIISLYKNNLSQMKLLDKYHIIQILVYLTYFQINTLTEDQITILNQIAIKQITHFRLFKREEISYFHSIVRLVSNIAAQGNAHIICYFMDSNILLTIYKQLKNAQGKADLLTGERDRQQMNRDIISIKESYIELVYNMSQPTYTQLNFFKFSSQLLLNNSQYFCLFPSVVLEICCNYFDNQVYEQQFSLNQQLQYWYENKIVYDIQNRFGKENRISKNKFKDPILTTEEKDLFAKLLLNLLTLIKNNPESHLAQDVITELLNYFFLSEFLIQCAEKEQRKSSYVEKAIKIYEVICSNKEIGLNIILQHCQGRKQQDLLRVFLDPVYFTSWKVSSSTLSVLSKILSKDARILETFMELRIFDSIQEFLQTSAHKHLMIGKQIINFLELLTIMISSEIDLLQMNFTHKKEDSKKEVNRVVRLLQQNCLIIKIQQFQNHEEKQVADKALTFLEFLNSCIQGNHNVENKGECYQVQI